ncbi:MAG TPA: AsmA family protein [Candidatus Aquicultoraceae bacterium]|nr:AsmA family protein [Candidatus Aquicultoraceae bacterium]
MRKAAIVLVAVVVILILVAVLVPLLVPLDSFRPRIVAALEEKTGREISLSGLSLSLFPGVGVRITGLTVSADPRSPKEPFLSVPEAEARVAILPLFSGRAEFTRLILREPRIRFVRYADGTTSVSGILDRLGKGREAGGTAPPEPESGGKVGIVLRTVSVEKGDVSLRMEEKAAPATVWNVAPVSFRMTGVGGDRQEFSAGARIDGAVRGEISLAGSLSRDGRAEEAPYVLRSDGKVFGQPLSATGKVFPAREPAAFDLEVSFPRIETGQIAGIFPDPPAVLAGARPEGPVSLSAAVSGTPQALGFSVRADLTAAGFTLGAEPGIRKEAGTSCAIEAKGRYESGRLTLSPAEIRMPPLSASAKAVVYPATGEREWSAQAEVSSLAALGKENAAAQLARWSPEGRLAARAEGKREKTGAPETVRGNVDLSGVGFRLPDRPVEVRNVSGKIAFSPSAVDFSPVAGLLNGKRFSLDGKVSLGPEAKGRADLKMAYLDVDALFPPGEEKGKKEAPPEKPSRDEGGKREISARLSVAIDAGKARGVEFTDLKGTVRYEKGNLYLDDVAARMYGGIVSVSGVVETASASPDFKVKVGVRDVAAREVLSRKTSLADFLSGSVTLSADVAGGMKDFQDFTRTASGSGSVRVTDGKIEGVDLLSLAAGAAGLSSLIPGAGGGGAGKEETAFSDLSASFRIDGGKIRTDSLRIVSDRLGLAGKGAVGFDRTLDFQGVVRLSRELSGRIPGTAGKFLSGPGGQTEIPIVMKGPLTSPSVTIDPSPLARGAVEKLLEGFSGQLPGEKPAGGKAPPAESPRKKEPLKQMEDIFKQILPGRKGE